MTKFAYADVSSSLPSLFKTIREVGVPKTADKTWFDSIGRNKSSDYSMVRVLTFLGFVDKSKSPTDTWKEYKRASEPGTVMADIVTQAYALLFEQYPNADVRDDTELQNFFRSYTDSGKQPVARMAKTFKELCSLADFNVRSDNGADSGENGKLASASAGKPLVAQPQNIESPTPALHIDFQVHIAADAPPEQIDKIFESMAKHLYGKDAE